MLYTIYLLGGGAWTLMECYRSRGAVARCLASYEGDGHTVRRIRSYRDDPPYTLSGVECQLYQRTGIPAI